MSAALRLIFLVLTLAGFASPAGAAYDARGNVIYDGRNNFTYDLSGQPTQISGAVNWTPVYDGNFKRARVKRGNKYTYYIYSAVTGGLIYKDEKNVNKKTDYINVGGASLRIENGAAIYTHKDHLGSPIAATDAAGNIDWLEAYTPFGQTVHQASGIKKQQEALSRLVGRAFARHSFEARCGVGALMAQSGDAGLPTHIR